MVETNRQVSVTHHLMKVAQVQQQVRIIWFKPKRFAICRQRRGTLPRLLQRVAILDPNSEPTWPKVEVGAVIGRSPRPVALVACMIARRQDRLLSAGSAGRDRADS